MSAGLPVCGGMTRKGGRCPKRGRYPDGRCWFHTTDPEATAKRRGTNRPAAFRPDDPKTIEAARKGGQATARKRGAKDPYTGTILDLMDAAGLTGASWAAWRAFWKATFALPMEDGDLATYQRHTERDEQPAEQVDEVWMPVGRRGGKSHNAALAGLFLGIRFDTSVLAAGELAVVMILAADRDQARAVLGYMKGLCALDAFAPYVANADLKEKITLHNGVLIEVRTANFRRVRGYTVVGVVADEIAFWHTDEMGANPDSEIIGALRPAMATVPGSLLLGLSSPYAAQGELYRAWEQSFGKDDPHVLVWNASTQAMNPSVPSRVIERAFEKDPVEAASEYGADGRVKFRTDVSAFLDPAAVRDVTVPDRRELPPRGKVSYHGFVDPSGGSKDSFTLAIAHAEDGRSVLDCVREVRPPFSPDNVTAEFAATLKSYGLAKVTGDRYALQWVQERFQRHGIQMVHSERSKSVIYGELLPLINAGTTQLLDVPVLHRQLVALERRTARGGKDSIDHPRNGRDDVANAAAGALTLAAPQARTGKRFAFGGADLYDRSRDRLGPPRIQGVARW